jgi:rhamnosyltransferase
MPHVTTNDVAAVVVLYRPDASVLDNIAAFAGQVPRVFAVDNTETPDPAFVTRLEEFGNLGYVPMGANLGIAAALNAGVERALSEGYSWALTLDQDSTPAEGMVAELIRGANECETTQPIGLISPVHVAEGKRGPAVKPGCVPVLTPMTSGDLLSIQAWDAVGRFDETLFIDQVDRDLCLRMHQQGYAVLKRSAARLVHRLGAPTKHRFPYRMKVSNHSPIRRYYITRNRFVVLERYGQEFPEFAAKELRASRRSWLGILLYEDHKLAKLAMVWRGYRDFKRGASGPYPG